MTVSYTADVANASAFGCFWRILLRWKGSVYKLVWRELLAYLAFYYAMNLSYRHFMSRSQRSEFEKLKVYCSRQIESIPMSFVLGFYVTLIVKRWWDQYWILPLPDSLALYVSASIHGQDERARILRRTIMRYAMLSYIIMLQRISIRVKKRFPTLQHLVDTGLMLDNEKKIFDGLEAKTTVSKFWLPVIWASNLVNRARLEGRIQSDHMVQTILMELSDFRRRLGRVGIYDTVSVPLVYTQVVTMAVYTYFIAALIGRQWVHPYDDKERSAIYPGYELDLYFPIFLSLQFVFYIGWLKVAETLINPFGEDDDDYEINWLLDRHIQVSYMVVDEIHEDHPELLKDQYWDQVVPRQLPYNLASNQYRRREPKGSTASMKIKEHESIYDNLTAKRRSMIPEDVYSDYESVIGGSPVVDNRKNWIQRQISRVESFRSTSSASSLFNRNRSQVNQNGVLPQHNSQGHTHRLSLYDKLLNRRSSKEHLRNLSKSPPVAVPRANGGHQMGSLMPHSHTRPRVPTPEVSKETQININAAPIQKITQKIYNTAPGSPANLHPPLAATLSNGYGRSPSSGEVYTSRATHQHQPPKSPSSKSPPPSYDLTESPHIMLSPIEENDSSPYSTSSTNRSSRNSNYPTTNTIFGRKPSPPPPKEELPPLPYVSSGHDSETLSEVITSDSKSMESATVIRNYAEEPYMTIDEVGDTDSGLELRTPREESGIPIPKYRKKHDPDDEISNSGTNDTEFLIPYDQSISSHSRQNSLDRSINSKLELISTNDGSIININGFHSSSENEGIDREGHVNQSFASDGESLSPSSISQESIANMNRTQEQSPNEVAKDCEVFV